MDIFVGVIWPRKKNGDPRGLARQCATLGRLFTRLHKRTCWKTSLVYADDALSLYNLSKWPKLKRRMIWNIMSWTIPNVMCLLSRISCGMALLYQLTLSSPWLAATQSQMESRTYHASLNMMKKTLGLPRSSGNGHNNSDSWNAMKSNGSFFGPRYLLHPIGFSDYCLLCQGRTL